MDSTPAAARLDSIAHDPRSLLWHRVDRLIDRMEYEAILAHDLGPLAAARWRELGRPVPAKFVLQERATQVFSLVTVDALRRAREAYPGRMLVLKGPEIAAHYPDGRRRYGDLDLLVDNALDAFDSLLAAGFETTATESHDRAHHLRPLWWPGVEMPVEIHTGLGWPRHLEAPANEELFEAAVASALPVPGLEAPSPAHHTIITAAHGWKHLPLRSVRDLIDVRVLAAQADQAELERVARRWGTAGIWRTTDSAARWLLADGRRPASTRLWAQHLRGPREPTIFERHVRRWVTPFWMLPFPRSMAAAAKNIAADVRPSDGEPWRAKLRRIAFVSAHPTLKHSARAPQRLDDEDF